jgi:hypothetical protein
LEVILHLLPLDIHLKSAAAKSAIHLRESGFWKQINYGHGAVLLNIPGLRETTDYTSLLVDFNANYSVRIPDRSEWDGRPSLRDDAIPVFTDGSKMEVCTGAGVYSERLNLSCSYRLPDGCSVFQAEVLAICEAAKAITRRELPRSRIVLYSDSRAALGYMAARITNSKLENVVKLLTTSLFGISLSSAGFLDIAISKGT